MLPLMRNKSTKSSTMPNGSSNKPRTELSTKRRLSSTKRRRPLRMLLRRREELLKMLSTPSQVTCKTWKMLSTKPSKTERIKLNSSRMRLTLMLNHSTQKMAHQPSQKKNHLPAVKVKPPTKTQMQLTPTKTQMLLTTMAQPTTSPPIHERSVSEMH